MIYGYARVSTTGQDETSQVEQLTKAGAVKIFREKESGANADRPQLKKAIAALDQGDVLLVTAIDRMARSTRDLLNIVHDIKANGATFNSLSQPWVDTSSPQGEFVLEVFGAAAKLDRSIILERTNNGRKRAMSRGVKMGRKPKLSPAQAAELRKMHAEKRSPNEICSLFGIGRATFWRYVK